MNNRTYIKDNQLAVYTDDNGAFLVYKIDLAGIPVSKTVLVDAHSGEMVKVIMQTVNDGPTVGQGITNLGTTVDSLQMYSGNGFAGPNYFPNYLCEAFCWDYGDCDMNPMMIVNYLLYREIVMKDISKIVLGNVGMMIIIFTGSGL